MTKKIDILIKRKGESELIKDIFKKDKQGLQLCNLIFITNKKDYPKYRNKLVKARGLKGLFFNKNYWQSKKKETSNKKKII